jgi:hypothetical protein
LPVGLKFCRKHSRNSFVEAADQPRGIDRVSARHRSLVTIDGDLAISVDQYD